MKSIKFSICIPNYNYSRYIDKTILSILNQSYQNFEIIVADNASSDNSVEVVRSFGDDRIKIVTNPFNIGFSPNLDRATEQANGDYLILISSDDLMKAEALQVYANLIQEYDGLNQDLVISSSIDIIDGFGKIIGGREALGESIRDTLFAKGGKEILNDDKIEVYYGHDLLRSVLQGSLTNIGKFLSTCYSKQLYEKICGYNSIMSTIPDAHFSHKLMINNPIVIFCKKKLFQYRIHQANNYIADQSNIKILCDKYVLTQLYNNLILEPIGMSQLELQKKFIVDSCIVNPFYALLRGKGLSALRHYAFGWAAYPEFMVKNIFSWLVVPLFFIYPIPYLIYCLYGAIKK